MNYRRDIEAVIARLRDKEVRLQGADTGLTRPRTVIEFPLICCKWAAFSHLLFFSRRQIITVDTWKVTQKNDDASYILNYLFRSVFYLHSSSHFWAWMSLLLTKPTDWFPVSQFLKIRICLSGITGKYPLSSILNYSKLCLTQYQVYRFTKHTVSAKIWQKCKFVNILNSGWAGV